MGNFLCKARAVLPVMRFKSICINASSSIVRFLKSIWVKVVRYFDLPSKPSSENYGADSPPSTTQENSSEKDEKVENKFVVENSEKDEEVQDEDVRALLPRNDLVEMSAQNDAEGNDSIAGIGDKRMRRIERRVIVKTDEERWINHYSSSHRILLVGEGDFSFAACLAVSFGNASKIIATSLNKRKFLLKNYKKALSNMEELTNRGCKVMYGIDATEMANHNALKNLTFDRIVFNFPFAGFFRNRSPESVLHLHRSLVSKFLMNAKKMISENGEIHISHKTNSNSNKWNLENIASSHGLRLIEAVKFKLTDYPGYNTKRGFGGDKDFNCHPSKTFKFGLKV